MSLNTGPSKLFQSLVRPEPPKFKWSRFLLKTLGPTRQRPPVTGHKIVPTKD